jgi:hypothetical protein
MLLTTVLVLPPRIFFFLQLLWIFFGIRQYRSILSVPIIILTTITLNYRAGLVEIDEDGSSAIPKVVFPSSGRPSNKVTSYSSSATSRTGGRLVEEEGRLDEAASPPPSSAQRQSKIWAASPAKLLAPHNLK